MVDVTLGASVRLISKPSRSRPCTIKRSSTATTGRDESREQGERLVVFERWHDQGVALNAIGRYALQR